MTPYLTIDVLPVVPLRTRSDAALAERGDEASGNTAAPIKDINVSTIQSSECDGRLLRECSFCLFILSLQVRSKFVQRSGIGIE